MISQTSLAIARHHAIAADFIADPALALTEVSYGEFSVSLGVQDAESLLSLYNRLTRPGQRPRVSVFESAEHSDRFGVHAFVMIREFYSTPDHADVEIVGSLLLTDTLDLHASRIIEPGLALIESLAATHALRKDTD